jgi:hypothetical protein
LPEFAGVDLFHDPIVQQLYNAGLGGGGIALLEEMKADARARKFRL